MKHLKEAIILIATSMLLCACPDEEGHRYITLVNKSGEKIAYQYAFSKISNIHQDTVFLCNKTSEGYIDNDSSFVLECDIRTNGWETSFENLIYLQILLMDSEKFRQYYAEPCDTARKYIPILHAYRLTLEDFQRMNWTVMYPPEE